MRDKLKSTSGASILVALLFFLICAMAGAVILTAASTSSGRIANLQSRDQEYYTLSSAARLLRDEIENKIVSIYTDDNDSTTGYNTEPDGDLKDLLKTATETVFKDSMSSPPSDNGYTNTLTISDNDANTDNDVNAAFTMDKDYSISIELSKDNSNVKYVVTIPAAISQNKEVDKLATGDRIVTTLTWTDATITMGQ